MCTSLVGHRAKAHSVTVLSPSHSNMNVKYGGKAVASLIILAAAVYEVFLILNNIVVDLKQVCQCMWTYIASKTVMSKKKERKKHSLDHTSKMEITVCYLP